MKNEEASGFGPASGLSPQTSSRWRREERLRGKGWNLEVRGRRGEGRRRLMGEGEA